ncbi:MAG: ATP-dependent DNA helicase RecG [Armatimonas sp.]
MAAPNDALYRPVTALKGVGEKVAGDLARLGLLTLGDLLYHFPRRWEDRSNFVRLADTQNGQTALVSGKITAVENRPTKNRLVITKVTLDDGSRAVASMVWFNQWRMKATFEKLIGRRVVAYGTIKRGYASIDIAQPEWEAIDEDGTVDSLALGRIVPVYPLTEGLSQTRLRRWIFTALESLADSVPESLPERLRKKRSLPGIAEALKGLHFPEAELQREAGRRRLAYEELLGVQLLVADRRRSVATLPGVSFADITGPVEELRAVLPFALTGAQQRAIAEIGEDMHRPEPMSRLVQGDVGAGKTAVAMAALTIAARNGYQAALMAPTEILAEQHLKGVRARLEDLGIRVDLLTGSRPAKEKRAVLERLASGETGIVVGTHALIQEGVRFHKLGLAIIDEQHRFGVLQRAALSDKGVRPDILVMTATPIPRTLTLTVYGDLDVSILDELPPGRKPIRTHWKKLEDKPGVWEGVRKMLAQGRQAYVICPLVEESEKRQAQAAVQLSAHLEEHVFPEFSVALVHGQLSSDDKDAAMERFRNNEAQVLVATTVIEVGVDVPNAAVIVILDADAFGLAQLHQLRGRVGRGEHASFCVLVADPKTTDGERRMEALVGSSDGFVIAEEDLKLRGPGEFFGTKQSGLPSLRAADVLRDIDLLHEAREDALALLAADPKLSRPENRYLRETFVKRKNEVEWTATT